MNRKQRILIVDDSELNLSCYVALLKDLNIGITTASSGEEAVKECIISDFDLIIMDVRMPGIDGFEALKSIRKDARNKLIPFLFISGYVEDESDIIKGLELGAIDFIRKPFPNEILRRKIKNLLELQKSKNQLEFIQHELVEKISQIELLNNEIRAADHERNKQNNFFKLALDSIATPFYIIDAKTYNLVACNEAARKNAVNSNIKGSYYYNITNGFDATSNIEHFNFLQEVKKRKIHVSREHAFLDETGIENYEEMHAYPVLDNKGEVFQIIEYAIDITERNNAQELLTVRAKLIEYFLIHGLEETLQRMLDEITRFVNSPIGFFHLVHPDQKTLTLAAWSTRTQKEFCNAQGKGSHYSIDKAGVWVDCFYQKKPVIHNDYESLPHKKGLPEGHAKVIRELVVPVMRNGNVVAILGVGNKPADYTQRDVEVVSYLADAGWDIAERRKDEDRIKNLLKEKELLLKEVHHRIKNNMAIAAGLLALHAHSSKNPLVVDSLREAQMRIQSMSILYDKLYRSENFSDISFKDYIEKLLDEVCASFGGLPNIVIEKQIQNIFLPSSIFFSVGIIVNELITNSIKYAFRDKANSGKITISVLQKNNNAVMIIQDDGVGIPESVRANGQKGFGLSLVDFMLEQIKGKLSIEIDNGTIFTIEFPLLFRHDNLQ
ncbi:MAG TPA: hypothetical protein DD381_06160 [Lentisphaeria bacterium]|nr:MAG: hypothetical protein A2X47_05255 [Lentisphaerae bacterium GWF2_38_69]HBM15910.1 hypothetical protein [Lentisphaeria bacterium]